MLLAAPWVLAGLLGAAAVGTRAVTSRAATGQTVAAAPSPGPSVGSTPPAAVGPPGTATSATASSSTTPTTVTVPTGADLLAVLAVARRALGTAGLPAGHGPRPDRWPVEVVLADVAAVTDRLHVATVHALVITADDDGWSTPTRAAVAVPLAASTDGFEVAGTPWPLPPPAVPPAAPPAGRAVDDPDPTIVDALLDLGWQVDEVEAVDLLDGAVLVLQVRGTPPDGGATATHRVWLLDAPGGPRPVPMPSQPTDPVPGATPRPQTPTPMPQEAP